MVRHWITPDNEQGVVYLFSHLARSRFGLRVARVQAGFPDCIAYQDGKRVRIEFAYRSRNFMVHRHKASGCDCSSAGLITLAVTKPRYRAVFLSGDEIEGSSKLRR